MSMFAQQADTSLGLKSAAQTLDQTVQRGFGPDKTLEHEIIDLKSVINKEAEQMAEAHISDLMKELDTNGDGVVSLTELRDASTEKNLNKLVQKGLISESQAMAMKEHAWTYQRHGAKGVSGLGDDPSPDPKETVAPNVDQHEAKTTQEESIEKILEAMRGPVEPKVQKEIPQGIETKTAVSIQQEQVVLRPPEATQRTIEEQLHPPERTLNKHSIQIPQDPFQRTVSEYLGEDLKLLSKNTSPTPLERMQRETSSETKIERASPKENLREREATPEKSPPLNEIETASALAEERRLLMKRLGMVTEEQLSRRPAA